MKEKRKVRSNRTEWMELFQPPFVSDSRQGLYGLVSTREHRVYVSAIIRAKALCIALVMRNSQCKLMRLSVPKGLFFPVCSQRTGKPGQD